MPRNPATADVFLALASPTRRLLLDRLSSRDQSVKSLAVPFRMSLAAVSQQLGILRAAGLVTSRRLGRYRVYHLRGDRLRDAASWLAKYQRFWLTQPVPRPPVPIPSERRREVPSPADGQWLGE